MYVCVFVCVCVCVCVCVWEMTQKLSPSKLPFKPHPKLTFYWHFLQLQKPGQHCDVTHSAKRKYLYGHWSRNRERSCACHWANIWVARRLPAVWGGAAQTLDSSSFQAAGDRGGGVNDIQFGGNGSEKGCEWLGLWMGIQVDEFRGWGREWKGRDAGRRAGLR